MFYRNRSFVLVLLAVLTAPCAIGDAEPPGGAAPAAVGERPEAETEPEPAPSRQCRIALSWCKQR